MIYSLHSFGDIPAPEWEPYCDAKFATNADLRHKCKSKPWSCCPFGICPPWAAPNLPMGASCRGLPKDESVRAAGSGVYDALYVVQTGMSAVSLVDKIAVPMQIDSIRKKEEVAAITAAQEIASMKAASKAAATRASVLKYTKWGGIGLAGVFAAITVAELLSPKRSK